MDMPSLLCCLVKYHVSNTLLESYVVCICDAIGIDHLYFQRGKTNLSGPTSNSVPISHAYMYECIYQDETKFHQHSSANYCSCRTHRRPHQPARRGGERVRSPSVPPSPGSGAARLRAAEEKSSRNECNRLLFLD